MGAISTPALTPFYLRLSINPAQLKHIRKLLNLSRGKVLRVQSFLNLSNAVALLLVGSTIKFQRSYHDWLADSIGVFIIKKVFHILA